MWAHLRSRLRLAHCDETLAQLISPTHTRRVVIQAQTCCCQNKNPNVSCYIQITSRMQSHATHGNKSWKNEPFSLYHCLRQQDANKMQHKVLQHKESTIRSRDNASYATRGKTAEMRKSRKTCDRVPPVVNRDERPQTASARCHRRGRLPEKRHHQRWKIHRC